MIVRHVWVRHPEGEEDLICPVFVCDACGLPIEGEGNLHYTSGYSGDDSHASYWHTHKSACAYELVRRLGVHTLTHDISEELDYLRESLRSLPPDMSRDRALPVNPTVGEATGDRQETVDRHRSAMPDSATTERKHPGS